MLEVILPPIFATACLAAGIILFQIKPKEKIKKPLPRNNPFQIPMASEKPLPLDWMVASGTISNRQ